MTTYRFTIRPACPGHCPDGWTDIRPLVPDKRWNYGEVDYPTPLTAKVADHWSLIPVRDGHAGLDLWPTLAWEGDSYEWRQLLGAPESEEVMYRYGTGQLERPDVEAHVRAWADSYETVVEVVWP